MGDDGAEERGPLGEEGDGQVRFVVGTAHVEEGGLFAAEFVEMDDGHGLRGDAGGDDAAAAGDGEAGLVERSVAGHTVENGFDAALVGAGEDFFGGVGLGGIDENVGAHGAGEFAAVGDGVDGEDAADAVHFEHGDGEAADGAAAEDGGGDAGGEVGELEGVEGDGEGFEEGTFGEVDAGGDGDETVGGDGDDVAEVAGVGAGGEEADVIAEVVAAGSAHGAVVAVDGRFEEGAVAGLPAGDPGAGGEDGAGGLVAEDHGEDRWGIADGALREVMQVRATDTAVVDPDLDFAGAGGGRGGFGDSEAVLSDELSGAHLFFEEVFEGLAGVVDRAGHRRGGGYGGGEGAGRFGGRPGGFAGHGDAGAEEGAVVGFILGDDADLDRLGALEAHLCFSIQRLLC